MAFTALEAAPEAAVKKEANKKKTKTPYRGKTQYVSLSLNLETLKELGPQFQGPKNIPLSKLIGEVIDKAQAVVNEGTNAKPVEVNKALISVKKLLNYLKQKKVRRNEHRSSTSDSRTTEGVMVCNVCSELEELESEVNKCCKQVQGQLINLLRDLQQDFACDSPIPISVVPFTITEPGKYCVTKNLVYNGDLAAITVHADNVTINFHNHSLTLNNSQAKGILVENASEFTLENDIIEGSALFKTSSSAAVELSGVHKALLTNIYTHNTTKGVVIQNSDDIFIENSFFTAHEGVSAPTTTTIGAGIWIDTSSAVTIDGCDFEGATLSSPLPTAEAANAVLVQGASRNIAIQNSSFSNWLSTITLNQVTGVLLDNCSLDASSLSTSNLLEVGSTTAEANDIAIRNCTLRQSTQVAGFDGIFFLNGSGCIMENVIVDVASAPDADPSPYVPASIHVGCAVNGHVTCSPKLEYSNIMATNCIVRATNQYGLRIENGAFIQFSDSQFTGSSLSNILLDGDVDGNHISLYGANNCIIKDSTITSASGSDPAVHINPGADNNGIFGCEISGNSGAGLRIEQYALKTFVRDNNVFANNGNGIDDQEATTVTFLNTSCKNSGTDCVNVTPSQQPVGPNAAVAGTNVCCTSS
ncbi:MAG: right-handed parallel beta-helix repeat-containing protein [Verrucomicrobia bacterium]|nr:right-handed parallel beta-helix repeat-containing protein [Verrucomicrobiota bacterium]